MNNKFNIGQEVYILYGTKGNYRIESSKVYAVKCCGNYELSDGVICNEFFMQATKEEACKAYDYLMKK